MALRVGLVGLPNVGKSTLFNALSQAGADAANFPFCTIEPNIGVAAVPDPRLRTIADLVGSARAVPTSIEIVDIAGLVRGASRGEGLGNQFLSHIREVDAVCTVVRCFDDPDVVHVTGKVDPVSDVEIVDTELILKDLETLERRRERATRAAKSGDKDAVREAALVAALHDHLAEGLPARTFARREEHPALMRELSLLTAKPVLYAANVSEGDLPDGGPQVAILRDLAAAQAAEVVVVSAAVEADLATLAPEERHEYLDSLGLHESGLERLVHAAYHLLGLLTFFTAGPKEARAWTVPVGARAPRAAREIHTDLERGFIRAEVMSFDDLVAHGSEQAVREAGRLRVEGKDYVVRDGDILHIRFNV